MSDPVNNSTDPGVPPAKTPYTGPVLTNPANIPVGAAAGTSSSANILTIPISSGTIVSSSSIAGSGSTANTVTINVSLPSFNSSGGSGSSVLGETVFVKPVAAGGNYWIQYGVNGSFQASSTFRYIPAANAPGITQSTYDNGFGALTACAPLLFFNPNVGGANASQGMINFFTGIKNSVLGSNPGIHISPWYNYNINTPVRNDAGLTIYRLPGYLYPRTITNINSPQDSAIAGPNAHGLNLYDGSFFVQFSSLGHANKYVGDSQIILNTPYGDPSAKRAIGQISSFNYTDPDIGRKWSLGWKQVSPTKTNRVDEESPGNTNIVWNSQNRVGINTDDLVQSFNVKGNIAIQVPTGGSNITTGIHFADGTFQYTAASGGGSSGYSGYSGTSGLSGATGESGYSGVKGDTGTSGYSGLPGSSGVSGFSGAPGGGSGSSGYSGQSGVSGFSGAGASGFSGFSGTYGDSGVSGFSGTNGDSGVSGFSGVSGYTGVSGFSGAEGSSGVSGFSGLAGADSLYNAGTHAGGTLTLNRNNGTVQQILLAGNISNLAITNISAAQSFTIILTQNATGNMTLTTTSSFKFASSYKTLSTAANAIDMLNIFYDGTTYYCTLTTGYA